LHGEVYAAHTHVGAIRATHAAQLDTRRRRRRIAAACGVLAGHLRRHEPEAARCSREGANANGIIDAPIPDGGPSVPAAVERRTPAAWYPRDRPLSSLQRPTYTGASMANDDLRELLAQLHARLGRAGSLDTAAKEMLLTVSDDIERALAENDTPPAVSHEPQQLEALAARFEVDHPALATVLRQIIDTLGKAGI
jgi:hypothetical protein